MSYEYTDQNLMEVMHGKIETLEWKRKEKYFTNIYIRKWV